MHIRALQFEAGECAFDIEPTHELPESDWVWIDIIAGPDDTDEITDLAEQLGLDALAVRDAVEDIDLPKVDDFGSFLLVVLHALDDERIETYELDCFLSERRLVTIHDQRSASVDALWDGVLGRPELASGGPDQALARLADVATRRLVCVLDVFDDRNEELIGLALQADADFLLEITAVRADLAALRRAVHPQREALDILRHSTSPLVSDAGHRRFSDVFDTASRASQGVDGARAALAETLDAYRGAEARQATEVTKVLTVYAAIMLPLSLVAGFFGMNFVDLPLLASPTGWIIVTGIHGVGRHRVSGCVRVAGVDASTVRAHRGSGPRSRSHRGRSCPCPARRSRLRDLHHADALGRRPGALGSRFGCGNPPT